MKRPYLPIIAGSILIGICIGWVMKSAGNPGQTAGNQQAPERHAAVPTKAAIREERPKPSRPKPSRPEVKPEAQEAKNTFSFEVVQPGGEMDEKTRAMLDQAFADMNRRRENEDNARVAEMVAKYGLTPEQEEKLRAHFASRREQLAGLMSGKAVPNAMDLLSGDGFDEFAQAELTDEQKKFYEEEKVAAQTRKIESTALKNLAALTDLVGLRPEQRDAAYEVLYNRAQSNPTQESSLGGLVDGIVGGLGAGGDIGVGVQSMVIPGQGADEATLQKMREQQQQEIEQKVGELSGILDETQLGTYRAHLQNQGAIFPE